RREIFEFIQAVDVRAGAGLDDIGRGAAPHNFPSCFFELDRDFPQGLGATGNGANFISVECGGGFGHLGNGFTNGVDGPVSDGRALAHGVADTQPNGGGWNGRRAAVDVQIFELVDGGHRVNFVVQDSDEI